MSKLFDLARVTTTTTGQGDITLGPKVASFLAFDEAGVVDGDEVTYGIVSGQNREMGRGTVTAGVLTRTTVLKSTAAGGKINLAGTSQVYLTLAAEDVTTQAIPSIARCMAGAGNPLSFTAGNVVQDHDGCWTSGDPTKIVIPAGVTRARITGVIAGSAGSFYGILYKNGTAIFTFGESHDSGQFGAPAGASQGKAVISPWLNVAPGDYFQIAGQNTSTSGLNYSGWMQAEFNTASGVIGGGGGGGGGASALADLTDVDVSAIGDGKALVYDATADRWVPATLRQVPATTGAADGSMLVKQTDGSSKWATDTDVQPATSAGSHRAWRVYFPAGNVSANTSIVEMEFLPVGQEHDDAHLDTPYSGGTAVWGARLTPGWPAEAAFDGDTTNANSKFVPGNSDENALGYIFPTARDVWKVAFALHLDGGASPPTDFTLQYSDALNDTGWVDAHVFTGLTPSDWHLDAWTVFSVGLASAGAEGAKINLANARDVNFSKVIGNNGRVLAYDHTSGKFVAYAIPAGFSGSWDDLADKPTLFSGHYDDLDGKPTIPSGDNLVPGGGTDGQVLTKVSGHRAWADAPAGGGGGGGTSISISVPSALKTPKVSDFTWVNQNGCVAVDVTDGPHPGITVSQANSQDHNISMMLQPAPAAPYKITMKIKPQYVNPAASWMQGGIALYNSGNGRAVNGIGTSDGTNRYWGNAWNSPSSHNANIINSGVYYDSPINYHQVENDGTYLKWKISPDGKAWLQIGQITIADFIGMPDFVGFGVNNDTGTTAMWHVDHWYVGADEGFGVTNALVAKKKHRYWKLRMFAPQGGALFCIGDIQFRTAAGVVERPTTGNAFANSEYNGSFTAAACFAGTHPWASADGTGNLGIFVGWDYGAGNEKEIVEIALQPRQDTSFGEAQQEMPRSLELLWSDDNVHWTPAQSWIEEAYGAQTDIHAFPVGNNEVRVTVDPLVKKPANAPATGGVKLFALAPLIPMMTANNAPSGTVDASSYYNGSGATPPWGAFGGVSIDNSGWLTNATTSGWISYEFAAAQIVKAYSISSWSRDGWPGRSPMAWTFEGYNTATSAWDVLDTRAINDNSRTGDVAKIWTPFVRKMFVVATPGSYSKYRLNVSRCYNVDGYMGIERLQMFGEGVPVAGDNMAFFLEDENGRVVPIRIEDAH